MKVVHALGKKEVSKDSEENIGFLLDGKPITVNDRVLDIHKNTATYSFKNIKV